MWVGQPGWATRRGGARDRTRRASWRALGTVRRADLVGAAREAGDAWFDVLVACAFNYEAHTTVISTLGRPPVLKARMNANLHMAEDLKNTGKGNLLVIFGGPDIDMLPKPDGRIKVRRGDAGVQGVARHHCTELFIESSITRYT